MAASHLWLPLAAALTMLALGRAEAQAPDPALVARGEYLSRAADCVSCHTAPEPGSPPYAGGYAIPSPMGPIISANITPSKTDGIGDYSLADFARAVREGVTPDGERLYPAMPYPAYAGITDEDVAALYAYFMAGVEPVDASPAETELPFPFNIRPLMIGWNLLYGGGAFAPKAGSTPEVERGQYLVEVLGHCGTCHTPRNVLMGEEGSRFLAGGEVGGWTPPNITSDPVSGIGGWPADEIAAFLKEGFVPGRGVAAGSMAEAVEHSLRHLTDEDLRAIAAYLKTVPPIPTEGVTRAAFNWTEARPAAVGTYETGNGPLQADLAQSDTLDGAVLYNGACATCHGVDGAGTTDHTFPSLTANSTVGSTNPANLVLTIAGGVNRQGASHHAFMQPFTSDLSDAQIASVASYVTGRFGNPDVKVDAETVTLLRAGGPTPPIAVVAPWAAGFAIALLIFMAAAIVGTLLGRRRSARV